LPGKLARDGNRLVCAAGHCFDFSHDGYVNLLQPQDKRSRTPGDPAEAVAARRRLHDRGLSLPLLEGIAAMVPMQAGDNLLDVGCGEGFYAGNLALRFGAHAWGVDLSTPAVRAAARRYPASNWLIANADRFLPYASARFRVVLSVTARLHPGEFRRVLRADGKLLVAVPAPDDLVELRGPGPNRITRVVEMLEPLFEMEEQHCIRASAALDADAVRDVQVAIYRPMQTEAARPMQLTFSLHAGLFRPR